MAPSLAPADQGKLVGEAGWGGGVQTKAALGWKKGRLVIRKGGCGSDGCCQILVPYPDMIPLPLSMWTCT